MLKRALVAAAVVCLAAPTALAGSGSLESQALTLINDARARGVSCPGGGGGRALPALRLDARLSTAALGHARDMGERHYLSHFEPGGSNPRGRVVRAGYKPVSLSEIIYKHSLNGHLAASPVRWWLASPVHCRAIMNPQYTSVGIGYWVVGKSWTALLARPE